MGEKGFPRASDWRYCPLCGGSLGYRDIAGVLRMVCSVAPCEFVHWDNPVPVVAALVERDTGVILARNGAWAPGVFSMISGFLEPMEAPADAVVREVGEELGLTVADCVLLGNYSLPSTNQVLLAYWARVNGALHLSDEIVETVEISRAQLATWSFQGLTVTAAVVKAALQLWERS